MGTFKYYLADIYDRIEEKRPEIKQAYDSITQLQKLPNVKFEEYYTTNIRPEGTFTRLLQKQVTYTEIIGLRWEEYRIPLWDAGSHERFLAKHPTLQNAFPGGTVDLALYGLKSRTVWETDSDYCHIVLVISHNLTKRGTVLDWERKGHDGKTISTLFDTAHLTVDGSIQTGYDDNFNPVYEPYPTPTVGVVSCFATAATEVAQAHGYTILPTQIGRDSYARYHNDISINANERGAVWYRFAIRDLLKDAIKRAKELSNDPCCKEKGVRVDILWGGTGK